MSTEAWYLDTYLCVFERIGRKHREVCIYLGRQYGILIPIERDAVAMCRRAYKLRILGGGCQGHVRVLSPNQVWPYRLIKHSALCLCSRDR